MSSPSGPSSFILQLDKFIHFCKRLMSTHTEICSTGRLVLAANLSGMVSLSLFTVRYSSFVLQRFVKRLDDEYKMNHLPRESEMSQMC